MSRKSTWLRRRLFAASNEPSVEPPWLRRRLSLFGELRVLPKNRANSRRPEPERPCDHRGAWTTTGQHMTWSTQR